MESLVALVTQGINEFNSHTHCRNDDPTFLPVYLTGGIGDVIMALDAIEFLAERYQIVVYTHHLEALKYFNKTVPAFKVRPQLTWLLEFNTLATFRFRHDFKGFLVKEHEELYLQQREAFGVDPRLETLTKTHFDKFYLIAHYAREKSLDRRQFPMHCLGFKERLTYNSSLHLPPYKVITIHDGFDIHNRSIVSGRATKTWDFNHWRELVSMIKNEYPGYKIVQLGASPTARALDGVSECLIDKTTITEAFNHLKRSSLHIDGDSGLVHAAARFCTPTIALWGPTPDQFYGYSWNQNLRSDACQGSCYGVRSNWNDKCVIGHSTPKCMDAITPEMVMKEVRRVLR